jgi:hypothetical protein
MKKIVTLALAVLTVVAACSIRPEKNLLKSRE